MTYEVFIPALIAAARRAPTPAGLASVHAALTGRPTPSAAAAAFDASEDAPVHRHSDDELLSLAIEPAPAPRAPDPHDYGEPDPAFDWMFRPH